MIKSALYSCINKSTIQWLGLLMLSFNATALHAWKKPDSLQIHGFISQSYINTSANNFFGNSADRGTFKYREIGLNSSLQINPDLYLYGQLLFRQTGNNNDNNMRLDHGIIDYTLYANQRHHTSLRGGRVKIPLGFYNETRDVPITRPSIFLPQSIYFDRTRNLALSGDGIQFFHALHSYWGEMSFNAVAILPNVNGQDTEPALLRKEQPGKLKAKPTYIGKLQYKKNDESFLASLTSLQLNIDYQQSNPSDELLAGKIQFAPWILSLQFNEEFWSVTTEYARRTFTLNGFSDTDATTKTTGESYYIQGNYRLSNRWELMLRYDVLYQDINDRTGTTAAKDPNKQAHNSFAKDSTLGISWLYNKHILLRGEFHSINGTGWLPISDNPDLNQAQQKWRLYSVAASYNF